MSTQIFPADFDARSFSGNFFPEDLVLRRKKHLDDRVVYVAAIEIGLLETDRSVYIYGGDGHLYYQPQGFDVRPGQIVVLYYTGLTTEYPDYFPTWEVLDGEAT